MAETNSTLLKNSRYVAGGITEVNSTALEWWERAQFQGSDTDGSYVVEAKFVGRLDLIAMQFLGDSRLWWVLAQYNAILDPFNEIVTGRVLRVPTTSRVQTMLSGKLGGVKSTREVPLTNISPIV
jgi:hypothetical protein